MGRRFVARGERYLAVPGVLLMLIAVGLVGASGWWSSRDIAQREAQAEQARVQTGADLLEAALTVSLEHELTAYRNILFELSRDPMIGGARVSVGGTVVASSDLSELDRARAAMGSVQAEFLETSETTVVGQTALVEVWGSGARGVGLAEALTPALIIAGVGLALMMVVYRTSRRRLGEIGLLAEALLAYSSGERAAESLGVDPTLGEIASAWNEMLAERESMRVRQLEGASHPAAAPVAGGGMIAAAVGALPIGVLICGADGGQRYANTASEIMLGSLGSAEGTEVGLCGFSSPEVNEAIVAAAGGRSRARWNTEIDSGNEQGTVFRVTVRPLEGSKEPAALVLVEDITKQRLAEHARSSFLARATHELRTPLTNIRLYAEQATDESETDPAERNRAINVINQETRRLERLVGDMLRSAEIENGSLTIQLNDLRLDAFFGDLLQDYRAQAEQKGIELVFTLPPKLPVIGADREKLALAVHNLLGNALKYTGKGGRVEVRFEIGEDGSNRFVFVDSGFGISPEDQAKLFDPYFRSSDTRIQHITGSGIGLGLARDMAKLHGGDILIDSEIGVGSTFTLVIPGAAVRKAA
ncbi:MAG: signal transduction histidine kinase [Phycisphaerales bacterium]|jgi:signal transduction histidine kinase